VFSPRNEKARKVALTSKYVISQVFPGTKQIVQENKNIDDNERLKTDYIEGTLVSGLAIPRSKKIGAA
jgi:hypothetical protein